MDSSKENNLDTQTLQIIQSLINELPSILTVDNQQKNNLL